MSRLAGELVEDHWRLRKAKTLVKLLALAPGLVTSKIAEYVSTLPTFRMEPWLGVGRVLHYDPVVPVCAHCGEDNPGRAKFCLACGSPLAVMSPRGGRAQGRQCLVLRPGRVYESSRPPFVKRLFGRTVSGIPAKCIRPDRATNLASEHGRKTWVLAHEVLVVDLSDVVGGNHDIAEALPPQETESNVPAFNRAR
jgi:hypothetical protein